MTFESYVDMMTGTLVQTGYESFLPTLCLCRSEAEMKVMHTDLYQGGEEDLAIEWALEFAEPRETMYLACRGAERTVRLIEFSGSDEQRRASLSVDRIGNVKRED